MTAIALRKKHRVCYGCGTALEPEMVFCPNPACGSWDIDDRRAKPKWVPPEAKELLPSPWSNVSFKKGGTVAISGNRGAGKTTICLALRPRRIITSEQVHSEVRDTWYRLFPKEHAPEIHVAENWLELDEDIEDLDEGDTYIVDSVSQLGSIFESPKVIKRVIEHTQTRRAKGFFVLQYNKDGQPLGPNQLLHLVDVVCTIDIESTGLRRLTSTKNRFGGLTTQYFKIDEKGQLADQKFRWAYSVEGNSGDYKLHLFPMKGSKLADLLVAMEDAGVQAGGIACAALASSIYAHGFVEPEDAESRKIFAEAHGLKWIAPEEATEMIVEARKAKKLMETEEEGF